MGKMISNTAAVMNSSSDFWFYDIGINVIPANTKEKNTFESWTEWQNKPIPDEVHQSRKNNESYNNGIAIIPGPIWRGPYKNKYLVAIDLDNKKAIEEFCRNNLEQLKQTTLIEQTSNPEKMHIYFIIEREIPNKTSDKVDILKSRKIEANEIPALEIKSNSKGIMFCAYSPHKNGSNYRIIGTLKPEVFEASKVEERISRVCKKYGIPYGISNNISNGSQIPIIDLWKPETTILEGHNRHLELLRIIESLLQNNKKMPLDMIKQMAQFWNQKHCDPPLDEIEFNRQWNDAIKFVTKKNNDNNNDINTGYAEVTGDNIDEKLQVDDNPEGNKNNNNTKSMADILVQLALKNGTLFKDEFGTPYSLLQVDNHYEVLGIDGNKFERFLSKLYYDNNDKRTANAESINNAIRTLGAKAIFEGKTIPLYLKTAWSQDKDSVYYDLSDDKRRCVKITKGEGWKIIDNQFEVLFKRFGHQSAQPEPLNEYDTKIMDDFVNSLNIKNEKHKLLVKVWVISLLIPEIAHTILLPYGEKGSAKSTLLKKIKMVIDPSSLDLFSISHRKEEFIQQLTHNYLCFYDNVRHEPAWLSDEACRSVTGAAASKRKLYSDDDDIPYRYKKILGFAGIDVIFTEPDALDRSIKIELERIKDENNIPDTEIEEEVKKQVPELLGYIFDVLSKALEIKETVSLKRLPRMGDFAKWGEAISRALGYKPLEFINTYFENIGEQNIEIIESNPFAEALSKLIDYNINSWISSPKTLTKKLREYADNNDIDSSKFPKNGIALSRRLNKIKSNLREGLGIEIIIDRITSGKGNKKQMNTAIIKIRKISPFTPVSPANKNDEGNNRDFTGDIENTVDNYSSDNKISPVDNDKSYAQIISDIDKTGVTGDTGDNMQKIISCHYCNCKFNSEKELLAHSINTHPGKPAQPDETITRLENEGVLTKND
jgi:hypothetical protein